MDISSSFALIKKEFERTIRTAEYNGEKKENGYEAKKSLVRSATLINYLHEAIKHQIVAAGVSRDCVFPALGETAGELTLTGFLKQKKQDICIKPSSIKHKKTRINWGPLQYMNREDEYGAALTEKILSINVRSQMSSMDKNFDTLMERTFAESCNLHERYPKMCLGEVYFIPAYSYDDRAMKENKIQFNTKKTNIEKYISFFHSINNRKNEHDSALYYERCALLIVDFDQEKPKVFQTTKELKEAGLVSEDFSLELAPLSINGFVEDLLFAYDRRFGIDLLLP